jgi:hypothetical protein
LINVTAAIRTDFNSERLLQELVGLGVIWSESRDLLGVFIEGEVFHLGVGLAFGVL